MVSATIFTTAARDHPVDILVRYTRRFQFLTGLDRLRRPQLLFKSVQTATEPQELIWFKVLGSSNDLVDGNHGPMTLMNCL